MHKYNEVLEISLNSKLGHKTKWRQKAAEELTAVCTTCDTIEAAIKGKHDEIMERRQGP